MNLRAALYRLVVPGGLVWIFAAAIWFWQPRPALLSASLPFYPYFVVILATFLAWRFRRSCLLLILLMLVVGYCLPYVASDPATLAVSQAVWTVLFPVNLTWLALSSERQLFSLAMLGRLLILIVPPVVVAVLYQLELELLLDVLHYSPVSWIWQEPILPIGWLAFTLSFVILVLLTLFRPTVEHASWLWMLSALLVVEYCLADLVTYVYSTVVLLLIVGLFETSYAMAFRDELTGLESRRAMVDYLNRLRGDFTLAVVDIDHFKKVNDSHGHDVGDQVLKMVAGLLGRVSAGGRAFRYGGEEFVLVFSGGNKKDTLIALEALREKIASSPFSLRNVPRPARKPKRVVRSMAPQTLRVTVSIGLAKRLRGQEYQQVIKLADQALYRAKRTGRNRVVG